MSYKHMITNIKIFEDALNAGQELNQKMDAISKIGKSLLKRFLQTQEYIFIKQNVNEGTLDLVKELESIHKDAGEVIDAILAPHETLGLASKEYVDFADASIVKVSSMFAQISEELAALSEKITPETTYTDELKDWFENQFRPRVLDELSDDKKELEKIKEECSKFGASQEAKESLRFEHYLNKIIKS